jgi:SpoVK/Ycf46/Vps4 family AAA+-type ATPase
MDASASCYPRLTLIAVPRPSERDRQNLFVRLAPQTAWRLHEQLINSSPISDDGVHGGREVHAVDFLPLEIVLFPKGAENLVEFDEVDGGIRIHASYNGGSPSAVGVGPKSYENIIELPLDLHPSLQSVFNSTSEPILTSVRVLTNVPIAKRVTFEPLSVSDWEMIEMESTVLEDGGLLNQITVVSPDQVFPLNFGNFGSVESSAWIKVVDDDTHTTDDCNSSFSSDSDMDESLDFIDDEIIHTSTTSNTDHRCVRLMAETEVVIIPKPRMRKAELNDVKTLLLPPVQESIFCPSTPLRVQFNLSDVHQAMSADIVKLTLPNPPLGYVFVHPSTLTLLPGFQQRMSNKYQNDSLKGLDLVVTVRRVRGNSANSSRTFADQYLKTGNTVVVAKVFSSDNVRDGHIGMNSLLRHQLGVAPLSNYVSIQLWSESRILDSIASARIPRGMKIKVTKISTEALTMRLSTLNPWNFPDGFCKLHKPLQATTCVQCQSIDCDGLGGIQMGKNVTDLFPLFSSGSILPSDFLRELDPKRRICSAFFMLTVQPIPVPLGDHMKRSDCVQSMSSRLVPIITTNHLRELVRSDEIDTDETVKATSLDADHYPSSMLSLPEKPTVGFNLAIQGVLRSARQIIYHPKFYSHNLFASYSTINNTIMITGEVGSGKTHLACTAASQLAVSDQFAAVYLDCKKLQSTSSSIKIILEEIQKSFHEALHKQPSVLVLDDLDALIPKIEFSDGESDGSIHHHLLNPALVTQVKITVDQLILQSKYCSRYVSRYQSTRLTGIVLVCTCRDKDSLSTRFQESGFFHSLIEVPSLNATQRAQFLHNDLRHQSLFTSERVPHVISRLGKDTDGFRPKDLRIVASRIMHLDCLRNLHFKPTEARTPPNKFESEIESIIASYLPLSQQLVDIVPNTCSLDWASIGGLYRAKQSLFDIVIHPMKFKSVYDNAPITIPSGILLYGPPGNGKSFIVPLLAKTSKLTLITCRGPELLDRYIGASEAKVRQLFARAAAAAPAMIFFDEFDSLAPQRGSDHTGVTDRVVNQLLTLLDGAERSRNANCIFVVAATSRPDKIDKALLRPGRLEKHVYVGYPESLVEWNSLFSSLLNARNIDDEVFCIQQGGDLYSYFCKDFDHAKDFSAADMKAVLDTAHLLCVHEMLDKNDIDVHAHPILRKCHILEAFKRTRSSLLSTDRRSLQRIYASFGDREIKQDTSNMMEGHRLKTSLR